MDIDAFVEGVRFNIVRNLALEMLPYRLDAAYHIIELGTRLHYLTLADAKELRDLLDTMREGHASE